MLGHDHALSGAVAFAGLAPLVVPLTLPQLIAGFALTAGAALLPDFDEPGSTISRDAGFVGMGFAHVVRFVARGHRRGTHCLPGVAVFTAIAAGAVYVSDSGIGRVWLGAWLALMITAGLHVVPGLRRHARDVAGVAAAVGMCFFWRADLALVPACVLLGVVVHLIGDMSTHGGCPLLWPFSEHRFHDSPVLFTTGKFFESAVVTPVLTLALAAAVAWDTGLVGYLAAHTSGHLAR